MSTCLKIYFTKHNNELNILSEKLELGILIKAATWVELV